MAKPIHDHDAIRDHLFPALKMRRPFPLIQVAPGSTVSARMSLSALAQSEWSPRFECLMRNRLIMGAFRYGLLNSKSKKQWDRMSRIAAEVELYAADGNLERLVDIANMALMEFEEGKHPRRHFAATDDGLHCREKK